ncbi:MAG: TIGR00730 family Rossman fold protein, partial [Chlamydiae bacterium CG10_big_fil_rev_8_21_14_0_10_42_34]
PVYLVGKEYWKGMLDWIKDTVLAQDNIKKKDFDLIFLTDDPDEIADGIEAHYRKSKSIENF